jgi:uncharacterized OB-fold protein
LISDEELLRRLPTTRVNHDNKEFYRGWLSRELRMNRCNDCGHWQHPPRPVCPRCWSHAVTPTAVSGRGTIHLLTRLYQGPPTSGVSYERGWPVATVELVEQEGLRYTTTVVGIDAAEIVVGMPVELTWIERDGANFPVFRPAVGAA